MQRSLHPSSGLCIQLKPKQKLKFCWISYSPAEILALFWPNAFRSFLETSSSFRSLKILGSRKITSFWPKHCEPFVPWANLMTVCGFPPVFPSPRRGLSECRRFASLHFERTKASSHFNSLVLVLYKCLYFQYVGRHIK